MANVKTLEDICIKGNYLKNIAFMVNGQYLSKNTRELLMGKTPVCSIHGHFYLTQYTGIHI